MFQTPRARVNWTPCRLRMGAAVSASQTPRKIMCKIGTHKLRLHFKLSVHLFSSLLLWSVFSHYICMYLTFYLFFSYPTISSTTIKMSAFYYAPDLFLSAVNIRYLTFRYIPAVSLSSSFLCFHLRTISQDHSPWSCSMNSLKVARIWRLQFRLSPEDMDVLLEVPMFSRALMWWYRFCDTLDK